MSLLHRNNVQLSGKGSRTIVLGHGLGTHQEAWRRVLPFLEQRYQVVRYDLTGLGRSDSTAYDKARHDSLLGHADDLLELCGELALEDALFVGHSVGGIIGLLASLRDPLRFRKLALISSSPHYLNEPGYTGGFDRDQLDAMLNALARDYGAWCEVTAPRAVGEPLEAELTREVLADFKRVDPAIAYHFTCTVFHSDHRADLARLRKPTLILQAASDPFVPMAVADFLRQNLTDSELKVLPGRGGHYPHLGAPNLVIEALRAFLAT